MKLSDHIAEQVAARGVVRVFELTGGMITHLLDSMHLHSGIEITSMHHEQAAAFAAEAWARITGIPGVALATSGPGATNLLTGIASCWFDSTPAVFITGQVNTGELRGPLPVRQIGFQETDIVSMALPVTKAAWLARDADEVPWMIADAFDLAVAGRPGPVLIDVPMDVQRAETAAAVPTPAVPAPALPSAGDVERVIAALEASRRPLVLAGAGVRIAGATDALRAFVTAAGIPVVTSLPGLDAMPYGNPLRVGMIGTYGNRWANLAMGESDLLLVIGSRLDIRQTSAVVDAFRAGKTVVQVDADAGEIGARIAVDVPVVADAKAFLDAISAAWDGREGLAVTDWRERVRALAVEWPDTGELAALPGINPAVCMHALSQALSSAAVFVADVGQHQMWAGQSLEIAAEQRFLTSAGLGSMGWALPASIGAALALRDRAGRAAGAPAGPVVCVTGDGGLQINIQELESVVRLGVPVKIVVMDNACLGMVRQFQDDYFESRRQSTEWGYGAPDFVEVARAYGIEARSVSGPDDLEAAMAWLAADPAVPALLRVEITGESTVSPKVAFGHPVHDMDPPAGRV